MCIRDRAHSNHRYDTADYLKIDPLLGTEEDFSNLCEEAHKQGIHVLLDGVFNHTGSDSIYFNKKNRYPGKGAYNSKKSRYYGWYQFTNYPDEYACWWGVKIMPTLNKQNPAVQQFFMGKEGVEMCIRDRSCIVHQGCCSCNSGGGIFLFQTLSIPVLYPLTGKKFNELDSLQKACTFGTNVVF